MSLSNGMEEYYQRVIQLQEKLRQSEEERLKLEMKFNEMLQMMKEEEEAHFKKLRSKYKQFLEEDRRRQQRNDKILEALDRIENRTVMWEAKTEKFKVFRKRYQDYLKYPSGRRSRSPLEVERNADLKHSYETPERKTVFVDSKGAKDDSDDSKDDIVHKYLQSLSSQKCKEDVLQRKAADKVPPESRYSNLGNINSYWKTPGTTEKTDPEKSKLDSIQLKTNKDLQNSLKQNGGAAPLVTKYDYSDLGKSKYMDSFEDSNTALEKNKVPANDLRRESTFSNVAYNQQQYNYDNDNATLRRSSQHLTNNGIQERGPMRTSNQSPEQVHNELEQLVKQHKDETNSIQDTNHQRPFPKAQIGSTQPLLRQQFQPAPGPPVTPTSVNKNEYNVIKPKQEYQATSHAIEKEMKDDKIPSNSPQHVTNHSSPRPSQSNLQTLPNIYDQPQQRVEIAKPEFGHMQTKNEDLAATEPTEILKTKAEESQMAKRPSIKGEELEPTTNELGKPDTPVQQCDTNGKPLEEPTGGSEPEKPLVELPVEPPKPVSSQEYNASEQQLQYDTNGQPIPQYDDNGQYNQQFYNENGQPLQQHDEHGQPLQQYDESGQPLQTYYDENGQPLQQYDESGQPVQQYYDNSGQPLQQYDENGQLLPQYDENGQPIAPYDENGQPIAQYDENGQPFVQYDQNAQPQYDENGQPITQYDENGQPLPQYDQSGQPLPQYDENGQLIPQYDANGQLITQYDENGQPIQQYYDENGQPIQYYGEGESAPQYDENGQLIEQQYSDQPYGDQQQYYDQQQDSGQPPQEQQQPNVEAKPKVLDMLDTDTESAKQDTKVSNDSNFDFSNG